MRPSFAKRVTLALLLYTLSAVANPVPATPDDLVTISAECTENCSSKFTETSTFTSSLQSLGDDVASTTDSANEGTPTNVWPSSSEDSKGDEKSTSTTSTTMGVIRTESRISTTEFPQQTRTPTISFDPPTETSVAQTAHTEISVTMTGFPPVITDSTTENPFTVSTIALPIPHTESSVESGFGNPTGGGGGKPTSGLSPGAGHLPGSTTQNDANPTVEPFPINDGQSTPSVTSVATIPPVVVVAPSAPVQVILPIGLAPITLAPDALPTPGGTTVIGAGSSATTLSFTTNAAGQTIVVVIGATATVGQTLTLTTVTTLPASRRTGTTALTPTKSSAGGPSSSSTAVLPSGAAPRLLDDCSKELWKAVAAILILAVH